jgi:hypothetical protein
MKPQRFFQARPIEARHAGGPVVFFLSIPFDRIAREPTNANVNNNYTWQGALEYVNELNAMNGGAGFAGHNDWRLPNIREPLRIVDYK